MYREMKVVTGRFLSIVPCAESPCKGRFQPYVLCSDKLKLKSGIEMLSEMNE